MKFILIASLVPLIAFADLTVVCKPSRLTFKPKAEVEILIYVKNDGDKTRSIPVGRFTESKQIIPWKYLVRSSLYNISGNKLHQIGNEGIDWGGDSLTSPGIGHDLQPKETVIYKITWDMWDVPPEETYTDLVVVVSINIEGLGAEIPPLTLIKEDK